ncbi:unnamed protein product [marine sediment metagenome]|uniref:Uncharacterized protein n=1 Tax=marine sediment metagenome TaxID=412755 RepID=X1N9K0_9ZZZZ
MPDSNSHELLQAEELINSKKMDEALDILGKVEGNTWSYFYISNYEEALEIALKFQ